jgi:hypothetical protein
MPQQPPVAGCAAVRSNGSFAEYASTPQDTLAGRLKAGQQVLLVGASGGVGLFAIQFAIQIAKALGRRGTHATMRAIVQDKYACPELGARASPWRHPRIGGQ